MDLGALPAPRILTPVPPAPHHLLIFAHTPPPVHGQSLMVQTLLSHLPSIAPHLTLHHVNVRLSRDSTDIGRPRLTKLLPLLAACFRALTLRFRHGPMPFYYIPAPAKRSALYRDWIVMLLCRPFFPKLILHWHAVGLGNWLAQHATAPERFLTQLLLGRADLSISLAPELLPDAQHLRPKSTALVPNGLNVPETPNAKPQTPNFSLQPQTQNPEPKTQNPTHVVFLGLCSREKGVFDLLTAIAIANRREPDAFRLTVAGGFATIADQHAFFSQVVALGPEVVRHVGFASESEKHALLSTADVFCYPTAYPHEAQPLAVIEALAHDLPIVATRWRAIPSMLPATPHPHIHLVEPARPDQLADALIAARHTAPPSGELHAHYLAHFTRHHHLTALSAALQQPHLSPNFSA